MSIEKLKMLAMWDDFKEKAATCKDCQNFEDCDLKNGTNLNELKESFEDDGESEAAEFMKSVMNFGESVGVDNPGEIDHKPSTCSNFQLKDAEKWYEFGEKHSNLDRSQLPDMAKSD